MPTDELKKQQELNNNMARLIIDFAGDLKKPVMNMTECLEKSNKTSRDTTSILPELSNDVESINDTLNTFVGVVTNMYLSANQRQ